MDGKKLVRVIKRSDVAAVGRKDGERKPRTAAREMVSTVAGWVADLKVRKKQDARAAIDLLFVANNQPTEA